MLVASLTRLRLPNFEVRHARPLGLSHDGYNLVELAQQVRK
jgi:hypothetical protein